MRLPDVNPYYKILVSAHLEFSICLPNKRIKTLEIASQKIKRTPFWLKQACTCKTSDEIFVP